MRLKGIIGICCVVIVSAVIFVPITVRGNPQPEAPTWAVIDQKAATLQPLNESSIRELVLAIASAHASKEILPALEVFTDRVTRSELQFQKGASKGISDERLVTATNYLAKVLSMPEYSKTNVGEVRRLRGRLMILTPHLIGMQRSLDRTPTKGDLKEMSPSEAFWVFTMLVKQKATNPNFQLTEEERRARLNDIHSKSFDSVLVSQRVNDREEEIASALRAKLSTMSIRDLEDEANKCLDLLGMEK